MTVAVGGQQCVGVGMPISLGLGAAKIRGSSFVEGPQLVGSAAAFPFVMGTLMVGPLHCPMATTPLHLLVDCVMVLTIHFH